MKSRTKLYLALGLLVVLAVRESGVFDFSLARTTSTQTSSTHFSTGERPERAYNALTVTVFEAGVGEPAFRADRTGAVSWTLVLDEPEFGGIQWLPLYKRDLSDRGPGGEPRPRHGRRPQAAGQTRRRGTARIRLHGRRNRDRHRSAVKWCTSRSVVSRSVGRGSSSSTPTSAFSSSSRSAAAGPEGPAAAAASSG